MITNARTPLLGVAKGSPKSRQGSPRRGVTSAARIFNSLLGKVAVLAILIPTVITLAWTNGVIPRTPIRSAPSSAEPLTAGEYDKRYSQGLGTRFGKLIMRHTCPATPPEHVPTVFWESSGITAYRPLPEGQRDSGQVDLLVGILSACGNPGRRQAIRESWMRLDSATWGTWRAVFILGPCDEQLADEQGMYGDLLFTSTPERYHSINSKVLAFFDYASTVEARFAMKTDDDTFVFVDRLLQELKRMEPGCLYWGASPHHMPRSVESFEKGELSIPTTKWFIHPDDFQWFHDVDYMAGGGYILSMDLVREVVGSPDRLTRPMAGPEDVMIGKLMRKEMYSKCHCGDSRFVAGASNFQGKVLFTNDGSTSDFHPCETSDVVHRTITIHGIHHTPHMADILRYATSDVMVCTAEHPKAAPSRPGEMIEDADRYRMMRTGKIWNQGKPMKGKPLQRRALPLALALANLPSPDNNTTLPKLNSATFNKVRSIMKDVDEKNKKAAGASPLLPPNSAWARLSDVLEGHSEQPLPWCTRLHWAHQAAKHFMLLEELGIMACDLSLESLFVNSSSLELELSAGQAWLTSPADGSRFHTMDCPFGSAQCEACFLYREEPMDWLPEAHCNTQTERCHGFDHLSQAKAAVHRVLRPLLIEPPLSGNSLDSEVMAALSEVSDAPFPLPATGPAPSMTQIETTLQWILSDNTTQVDGVTLEECMDLHMGVVAKVIAANNFEIVTAREVKQPWESWMTSGPFHRLQKSPQDSHTVVSTAVGRETPAISGAAEFREQPDSAKQIIRQGDTSVSTEAHSLGSANAVRPEAHPDMTGTEFAELTQVVDATSSPHESMKKGQDGAKDQDLDTSPVKVNDFEIRSSRRVSLRMRRKRRIRQGTWGSREI